MLYVTSWGVGWGSNVHLSTSTWIARYAHQWMCQPELTQVLYRWAYSSSSVRMSNRGHALKNASENEENITNRKSGRAPESMLPLKCNSYETHWTSPCKSPGISRSCLDISWHEIATVPAVVPRLFNQSSNCFIWSDPHPDKIFWHCFWHIAWNGIWQYLAYVYI